MDIPIHQLLEKFEPMTSKQEYEVSASHNHRDYCFEKTIVKVGQFNPKSEGQSIKYWATHPKLGCGKDYNSPELAIKHLFQDHACYGIVIHDQDAAIDLVQGHEVIASFKIDIRERPGHAPGRIVICHNKTNAYHPYVVWFHNLQTNGASSGGYHTSLKSAQKEFIERCGRNLSHV